MKTSKYLLAAAAATTLFLEGIVTEGVNASALPQTVLDNSEPVKLKLNDHGKWSLTIEDLSIDDVISCIRQHAADIDKIDTLEIASAKDSDVENMKTLGEELAKFKNLHYFRFYGGITPTEGLLQALRRIPLLLAVTTDCNLSVLVKYLPETVGLVMVPDVNFSKPTVRISDEDIKAMEQAGFESLNGFWFVRDNEVTKAANKKAFSE